MFGKDFPQTGWGRKPVLFESTCREYVSYEELARRVEQFVAVLEYSRKCLIFCFCQNEPAFVAAYIAAIEAGHAIALLDPSMNQEFKDKLINLYAPEFIIEPFSDSKASGCPSSASYLTVQTLEPSINVWRATKTDGYLIHPDLCVLLSTSGSTGSPKFVRLSRKNLKANADAIVDALGITSQDRAISSLPIYYSYGLSVMNTHLIAGGSVVLTDESPLSKSLWDLFRETECTSFAGVPFSYHMLDRIGFLGFYLPSLRTMTQAGGKLNDVLTKKFFESLRPRKCKLIIMYGQTEATARIACLPYYSLPKKVGSVGLPIRSGRLSILSDNEEFSTPFKEGEIIYYGPNVMMGYAKTREELARGDELQGRLPTGDLGYLDEEGFLYLTGRLKRIAKVFGMRISLDEVQAMFEPLGSTAVIDNNGQIIVFFANNNEQRIKDFSKVILQKLGLHHSSLRVKLIDEIPLQSNGKIDYRQLQGIV